MDALGKDSRTSHSHLTRSLEKNPEITLTNLGSDATFAIGVAGPLRSMVFENDRFGYWQLGPLVLP